MSITTKEEILHGETKNLEFKVELPKDTKRYTRTVIAFANTQGGELVIGVDDKTREIVGVDSDHIFQVMDSITNAVSASCTPQIIPDMSFQTIDGKTVVVARIAPGANRPYYLTAEGKEEGTYIRVAGTTRRADPEKIKDLEMEGARISWDELICPDFTVTEKQIKKLCRDIMKFRQQANLSKRQVTRVQLENWKLLKKDNDITMATNAFVLLTSDYFPFSKTQCAVFKGTERSFFLDKRVFDGPVYEQIENAVEWVLRNIRLEAHINGLLREENYELPVDAIREMIVNAHCHRNLREESCIQVSLFDDRLEVSSPGGLYGGITYEDIMNGHSKLRNRALANIFNQMGLIEAWGTGIGRIRELAKSYGLPEPEFTEMPSFFRVNLYRKPLPMQSIGKTSVEHRQNIGENDNHQFKTDAKLNTTQQKIINLLSEQPEMTGAQLAEQIGISKRNIENNIKTLRELGMLIRHGSARNGYWEVVSGEGTESGNGQR